jgi:hypothetical protein
MLFVVWISIENATRQGAYSYPEETCSRPEALGKALERVRVDRLWAPLSRLGARVARVRVVRRWPERRARGSRAAMMCRQTEITNNKCHEYSPKGIWGERRENRD